MSETLESGPRMQRRAAPAAEVTRVLAVDWSGAAKGAEKAIWLAEARDSRLVRLESGRSRRELVDHFIPQAKEEPERVVGLDFAFSFPE